MVSTHPFSRIFVLASWRLQIVGVRIGRHYLSLAGPKHFQVFSERDRRGVKVLPLLRGWRFRLRSDAE